MKKYFTYKRLIVTALFVLSVLQLSEYRPVRRLFTTVRLPNIFRLQAKGQKVLTLPYTIAYKNLTCKPYVQSLHLNARTTQMKFGHDAAMPDQAKPAKPYVSKLKTVLYIGFDNDIFDNTDYYYTNGINLTLCLPLTRSKLFPGGFNLSRQAIHIQGFTLTQKIYTPVNPETTEIPYGDHPFAGYLTVGIFEKSYDFQKQLSVTRRLEAGVLGPASLSGNVQSSVHEKYPAGWRFQVKNSPVVNLFYQVEKTVVSSLFFEANVTGNIALGSLFNNIRGGMYLRTGIFPHLVKEPLSITRHGKFTGWFFISSHFELVAYDGTLQGGLFSKGNPYVINRRDLKRMVFQASVGIALYYGKLGLKIENFYHTPRFEGAYDFRYGNITLSLIL